MGENGPQRGEKLAVSQRAKTKILKQVTQDQLRDLGSQYPATPASRQLLARWEGR
jgi:hypothetical protein